jgi:transposase
MLLTGQERGETLKNFKSFGSGDVVMGDRAYGNLKNIEYLSALSSAFILRMKTNAFNIYNERKEKTSIPSLFRGLKPGESGSASVYYLYQGEYRKVRLCAYRKTKEAEAKSLAKLSDTQNWKGRRKGLSEAQKENNRYVVLATSFEAPEAKEIVRLYRMRWQIELVFKRLKSLFGYNEVPVKLDRTARAWFYGKLLLAALTETWVNKARFSPLYRRNRRKQ